MHSVRDNGSAVVMTKHEWKYAETHRDREIMGQYLLICRGIKITVNNLDCTDGHTHAHTDICEQIFLYFQPTGSSKPKLEKQNSIPV